MPTDREDFRILSLDGGGAKGIYTLGILREVEALAKRSLCEEFDLIYGTSTGSIIAALLALGRSVDDITGTYLKLIPDVMKHKFKGGRTAALKKNAYEILGDTRFDAFRTDIGIVTTHYDRTKPMIFKSSVRQAHGSVSTFQPGFGCTIAEAIVASSAAFPFFHRAHLVTANQGSPELIDGGFVANNPTLLAIADAVKAYGIQRENIKVLSLGVGMYKEPQKKLFYRILFKFPAAKLALKIFEASSVTVEQLRLILFPDIDCIRINDAYPQDEYETDLLESDLAKLNKLRTLGRESFGRRERQIQELFGWTT
jgi:uncharacterized protein